MAFGVLQTCSSIVSTFTSVLRTIPKILFSILFFVLVIPPVIPLVFVNQFIRFNLNIYFILFKDRKYSLMAPEDSVWALESPGNCSTMEVFSICEGKCDIEKIRKKMLIFANGEKSDGSFSKKLKLRITKMFGYFCWEDCSETFDINKIVRFADGDPNSVFKENEVFGIMGKLIQELIFIGADQPQWEAIIFPNYIYNDESKRGREFYGICMRMHHSYADGISFTQRLQHTCGDNVVQCAIDPFKPLNIPFYQKLIAYLNLFFMGHYIALNSISGSEKSFLQSPKLTGPKTLGWTKPILLDTLKKIKNAKGTSINAVLSSATAGSLRQLALKKGKEVPEKIVGVLAAAILPYKWMDPLNQFTTILYPIHLLPESDNAGDRLDAAHKAVEYATKKSPDFLMNYWIIKLVGLFPVWVLKLFQYSVDVTVGVTNIPGPLASLELFDGSVQVDIGGWPPLKATTGIGFAAYSYNGSIRVGVVFDGCILSDPEDMKIILESFEQEIDAMEKLFVVGRKEIY